MKTKTKKRFDCVAMKRAGAAQVYRKTRGMTMQEKLEFWRRETEDLLREQQEARLRKSSLPTKKRKLHGVR